MQREERTAGTLRMVNPPNHGIVVRLGDETTISDDGGGDVTVAPAYNVTPVRARITRRGGRFVLHRVTSRELSLDGERLPWPTTLRHGARLRVRGPVSSEMVFEMPDAPPTWETPEPQAMMLSIPDPTGERAWRSRMFMAAMARRFVLMVPDEPSVPDVLERIAEGETIAGQWHHPTTRAWHRAIALARRAVGVAADRPPYESLMHSPNPRPRPEAEMWPALDAAEAEVCRLLRELFGDPSRPRRVDVELANWDGGTPLRLADDVDTARCPDGSLDPVRLSVLADALTDAGCADAELVDHLREQGPHYRGCWAVDAVLGRP